MRFFRRDEGSSGATADFWTWWSGNRDRVANAIATGGFDQRLIGDISAAVKSIHPAMAWELAPGHEAEHAFCISPEGNAEVRQAALRWIASAPPPDRSWEYHASKPAKATLMGLEIAGRRFDLEEIRTVGSWDPARRRLDVRLWHPSFDEIPAPVRLQVGFIFLDSLLGEDDVERWIGEIDLLDAAITDAMPPAALKADVERRKEEPGGRESWVVRDLSSPDRGPQVISFNAALKRIDHPFHDHHVTIQVVMGVDRPPTDAEAQTLDAEERDLLGLMGNAAVFVGRSTEIGGRTLHFVSANPDGMRPAIDSWAADLPDSLSPDQPQRRLKVNFDRDMDWNFQRELGMR